jgi:hypothetical protein
VEAKEIYVDPAAGNDAASGESGKQALRTIDAALARIPDPVRESTTIRLARGTHTRPEGPLLLSRRMAEDVAVTITGTGADTILDWTTSDQPLISAAEGNWSLGRVQIGTRKGNQRKGVRVTGPATMDLRDIRVRTVSHSAPGIHATRGGLIRLFGTIELNEDLHDTNTLAESFCGIVADYSGVVRFRQREGARLSIGSGSLGAGYYGVIELGCAEARITSWHDQANVIAVNNSGRIDLHNTRTILAAKNPRNTPVGLEHDGHVLAEGAPITIVGNGNGDGIVLQKASTFFCNDVTFEGNIQRGLSAMSGSTLLAGIVGDLPGAEARSGATIIVEKVTGKVTGPVDVGRGAQILMPE